MNRNREYLYQILDVVESKEKQNKKKMLISEKYHLFEIKNAQICIYQFHVACMYVAYKYHILFRIKGIPI